VTDINTEHASQASKRTLHKPTAPGYSCISDSRMRIYCVLVFLPFFNSIVDLLDSRLFEQAWKSDGELLFELRPSAFPGLRLSAKKLVIKIAESGALLSGTKRCDNTACAAFLYYLFGEFSVHNGNSVKQLRFGAFESAGKDYSIQPGVECKCLCDAGLLLHQGNNMYSLTLVAKHGLCQSQQMVNSKKVTEYIRDVTLELCTRIELIDQLAKKGWTDLSHKPSKRIAPFQPGGNKVWYSANAAHRLVSKNYLMALLMAEQTLWAKGLKAIHHFQSEAQLGKHSHTLVCGFQQNAHAPPESRP
jgi:hypothetical protein